MKNRLEYSLIIILLALYAILHLIQPYGDSRSLNAGVSIGISDTCQIGYETRGDIGFFAYCDK